MTPYEMYILHLTKDLTKCGLVLGCKKMTVVRVVVMQNLNYTNGQKVMFDLCVTRWLENLNGFSMSLTTLPYIVETLEVIG